MTTGQDYGLVLQVVVWTVKWRRQSLTRKLDQVQRVEGGAVKYISVWEGGYFKSAKIKAKSLRQENICGTQERKKVPCLRQVAGDRSQLVTSCVTPVDVIRILDFLWIKLGMKDEIKLNTSENPLDTEQIDSECYFEAGGTRLEMGKCVRRVSKGYSKGRATSLQG